MLTLENGDWGLPGIEALNGGPFGDLFQWAGPSCLWTRTAFGH
jgi:hypothetical protein